MNRKFLFAILCMSMICTSCYLRSADDKKLGSTAEVLPQIPAEVVSDNITLDKETISNVIMPNPESELGASADENPDDVLYRLDVTEDGVEDSVRIVITTDSETEHHEQLIVTDSTVGREHSCETDEFIELIDDRFYNELEEYREENDRFAYCYSFGFDENNLMRIKQDELESIVPYYKVVFSNYAHFSIKDNQVLVTYDCQTGWDEIVAYIEATLSVRNDSFELSDLSLRENPNLLHEITSRKEQTPVTAGDFTYQRYKKGWLLTAYQGYEANLVIPAEYDGLPIVGIGMNCFLLSDSIKAIDMPAVREAGSNSFLSSSLTKVSAPKLVSVGMDAFGNCEQLSEITFDEMQIVALSAFGNCTNLEYINLPEVRYIGTDAFFHTAIHSLYLPKLQYLDHDAFSNCYNLIYVEIPEIRYINGDPFNACSNVEIHTHIGNSCMIEYEKEVLRRAYSVAIIYE